MVEAGDGVLLFLHADGAGHAVLDNTLMKWVAELSKLNADEASG